MGNKGEPVAGRYEHDPRKAVAAGMTLLDQRNADLAEELTRSTGKRWTENMIASLVGRRRKLDTPELIEIQKIQGFPMAFYLYGPFAIGDNGDRVKGLFRELTDDSYNQLTIPQLVA